MRTANHPPHFGLVLSTRHVGYRVKYHASFEPSVTHWSLMPREKPLRLHGFLTAPAQDNDLLVALEPEKRIHIVL